MIFNEIQTVFQYLDIPETRIHIKLFYMYSETEQLIIDYYSLLKSLLSRDLLQKSLSFTGILFDYICKYSYPRSIYIYIYNPSYPVLIICNIEHIVRRQHSLHYVTCISSTYHLRNF